MTKRPGAAALAGGALLALLCPGAAVAQGGETYPREITGGYASWTPADDLTLHVTEPAVQGSGNRAWFPATGGGTDLESGDVQVEFGGAAQLSGTSRLLTLGALRVELADGVGNLYARTATVGEAARELALADVESGGTSPAVRPGGVTWTGLRASLTDEGARLLSEWSGHEFAQGTGLGLLDVTIGTGSTATDASETVVRPQESPQPSPSTAPATAGEPQEPSASLSRPTLTAGGEQTVTGAGFEPGEVVLVAVDADTRYQAVADPQGRVSQAFPVYPNATEGAHSVELYTVSGERGAVTRFEVRPASE
ncbi:HtaA domain-containing protein [Streptomyces sp. NPDC048420]|uniref:HtaA domain-containing protein n=1 Tax=Streptomyces sp. NPDC048420 TaxID=3155755 RepID=UPI00343AB684